MYFKRIKYKAYSGSFVAKRLLCAYRKREKPMCNLTYRQNGDYLIPDLTLGIPTTPPIGKYGRMRRDFLKNHHSILYNELIVTGRLYAHLREIDTAAEARLETIMPRLMQDAGITETLKAQNQMEWVRCMNAIKAQVEEIINDELIYG